MNIESRLSRDNNQNRNRGGGRFGRQTFHSPNQQTPVVCRNFAQYGNCRFGSDCKFLHEQSNSFQGNAMFGRAMDDLSSSGRGRGSSGGRGLRGRGSGRGGGRGGYSETRSTGYCFAFLKGTCRNGDDCRYMHSHTSNPDAVELVAELTGHSKTITGLILDGSQLYSSSKDGTIKTWDTSTGQCTIDVPCGGEVCSLLISGGFLFAGVHRGQEGLIKVWNMQTGVEAELTGHRGEVYCLAAVKDMLLTGAQDGLIKVWGFCSTTSAFLPVATLSEHAPAPVLCLEAVPGGDLLFSADGQGRVKIWNLTQGACVQDFSAHSQMVMQMVYWENHLLTCSLAGDLRVWRPSQSPTGGPALELLTSHPDPSTQSPGGPANVEDPSAVTICGCADAAQKPVLLAAYNNARVKVLELPSFVERAELVFPPDVYVRALTHGPSGIFFTGDSSGIIKVWKLA